MLYHIKWIVVKFFNCVQRHCFLRLLSLEIHQIQYYNIDMYIYILVNKQQYFLECINDTLIKIFDLDIR